MTQPRKPSPKSSAAKPVEEKKAAPEGAPKLETPEKKVEAPPKEAPRDDEPELETPENPAVAAAAPVPSEEELVDLPKADLKEEAAAHDLPVSGTKAELAERIAEASVEEKLAAEEKRQEQEALHVSISPVNSHAPLWVGRAPNSP